MKTSLYKCENPACEDTTTNVYASAGWIRFKGTFSRSLGYYWGGGYRAEYIQDTSEDHDYCSLTCLERHLESLEQEAKAAYRRACPPCRDVMKNPGRVGESCEGCRPPR
jgi:hypothetical protein